MEFTGERFIPDTGNTVLEGDHIARYNLVCRSVKNKAVLDIACGSGYGSHMLAKSGAAKVLGVDISTESIAFARSKFGDIPTLSYHNANAETFSKGTYDIITSFETIEHLTNRNAFLNNLKTMLNPGGTLFLSTPNKSVKSPMRPADSPKNKYHRYEYRKDKLLRDLSVSGFRVLNIWGQHLYPFFFEIERVSVRLRKYKIFEGKSPDLKKMTPFVTAKFFVLMAECHH